MFSITDESCCILLLAEVEFSVDFRFDFFFFDRKSANWASNAAI